MTQEKISKYVLNNYRMASYLLLAIGLINLRYQTGKEEVFNNSFAIFAPGILMLVITFVKPAHNLLARREVMALLAIAGTARVIWAITN